MANNTVKFDIKAAIDTRGLDEFQSQLGELRSTAEPLDRVLGQAVKSIKEWAGASRLSERNTAAATSAINALTSAMTTGGSEWIKGKRAIQSVNDELSKTTNAAKAANAVLSDFGKSTQASNSATRQISDLRAGLGDLIIQGKEYRNLLADIIGRETLLGRRTGRANVVASNQAFTSGILSGFGAPENLQAMPDTTAALRQRLSELSQEFPNVIRGSERYIQIATEMRTIESQLARDLTGTTQALRQRSAATQAKIDAVRAYNEQAIRERVINGEMSVAERRRTAFGDVPQAMRTESGAFIAPPYRSSGYTGMGSMYAQPIGPEISLQSAAALNQQYQKLADILPLVARGGERYLQISREMRQIERDLARDMSRSTDETNALAAARKRLADATSLSRSSRGSGFAAWSSSVNDRLDTQNAIDQYRQQQGLPVGFRSGAAQFTQGQNTAQLGPAAPTELLGSIDGIRIADSTAKIQTLGRTYDQVAQQIRDTAQAAGGSTRALQAERQAWEQLQASVAPATREYKQAGREMQRLDRQLGTSTRGERFLESAGAISAGAFFGGPEGLAGGLLGMAVGGPGAALGGASIGAQLGIVRKSIGDAATYSAEIGKLRIALKGVVGDTEEYNKALGVVSSVSRSLNIPVQEATQGFTRLAAAVVGAGGNVGDAEVVFKGVTSAIKATGGSSQDAQSAVLALSQVFSKGKVSAEELQGQLGERLPGAVTLFAQATGRTLPQLSKDLEQGTVGLNDLMRFTELLSSKYAANALTIARSTEDSGARQALALSNLREEFGKTFMPLGAALQDGASSWAEYTASVLSNINKIIQRYEILKGVLNIGGTALLGATPVIGPLIAGMSIGGQRNQSPQGRLANAGSTTMYSDAQGNVYDTATGKLLLSGGRANTNFADPKSDKSDEKARKAAEREERKRQEEAARQQRLELQLNNDRVRLDEQRAENAIRLEDRIFQHRQELMRRERDQQLQLDRLRQQILFTSLSPEGRTAAGPIQELLQRFQALAQDRQDIVDRLSSAEQALKSAQGNLDNVSRFSSAYQDAEQRSARPSDGDLQSSRPPGIGDQFLARILGGQFEEVAGLQPLPLQRMYRQMGRQVQRWTDMVENEAEYWLKKTYGTKKPLIPQEIIDSTLDRVRALTNVIQNFDPLELQFKELENKARGSSGQGRSRSTAIDLVTFNDIFKKIERRIILDANSSLNRAGGYLSELSRNADLSDFLPDSTRKFLADGIRQIVTSDETGFKRGSLERSFSRNFGSFFSDTVRTVDFERSRSVPARGGAGGYGSLELPAAPRTPSGGVDYLMQYRNLQELMEPPRITPGVQNQFDGASLIPLLKKFESVASLEYIPVSIENPDVIAQAIIAGGARTNRVRDRDAETTGWDITHPGGRGAPVRAPIDLTITGTGFQGRGSGRTGRGYGNWITGEFELGGKKYELLLGHFDRVDVAPGMRVPAGVQLGTQGITGRALGEHTTTHVNPKGSASAQDAWNALEQLTQRWERGGLTTTLSNGREIRTPGAAAAALRAASATGQVDEARAAVKQIRAELALFDRDRQAFSDLSVSLGIEQTVQSLKDQEIALRDNYSEWKVRNRLQLEGVKPEIIDFEVNKTNALERQKRRLDDMDRLMKGLGPAFDAIGKGDAFRGFMEQSKGEIQRRTSGIIALQSEAALAATDPMLEWQNKMNDLEKSARDFNDTLKLAINLSNQFSGSLASGFSSAVSSIISGNGSIQQSFADLFNNVSKMFIDTIARVVADQATQFLLSLLKPKPGFSPYTSFATDIGGSILGSLGGAGFGNLGGSVAGNFSAGLPQLAPAGITGTYGGFATGGVSSGPTSGYPVTLHGTEAIVPLPNGRAIPVEMKGSGGTNVVVNVNMGTGEASVSSSERDGQLLGTALSDAVQAELIRQQRPGGILYRR